MGKRANIRATARNTNVLVQHARRDELVSRGILHPSASVADANPYSGPSAAAVVAFVVAFVVVPWLVLTVVFGWVAATVVWGVLLAAAVVYIAGAMRGA